MNGEIAIIIAVTFSPLFALGGTEIPWLGRGYKFLRREILPLVWAILAYTAGFEWWRCLAFAVTQDVAFRLPYGDKSPVWWKFIVFMAMPLPSLWLGFSEWQLFSGALCFLMWILSNWKPTANIFNWVSACLLIGAFLGLTVGNLIAQTY